VLRSQNGERVLKAKHFQLDMLTTAREDNELIVAVRFPVHGRGVAFREVARRHGDFAMVAVSATVDGKGNTRLGVGGMAGTPVVRIIAANDGVKDAVEKLASGLEGYEDLHASAELRRDILRNLAPLVIAEAQKCAA
jgi:2-furoyl-CoA dehydrogenase FAD binding subunit